MLDGSGFYEGLTVRQAANIARCAYRSWDETLFKALLQRFQLPEKKRVKELSKGMKMKMNIALALAHRPKLLILDEATAGLDPVMRDDLLDVFLDFVQDEHHSILMSSHITTDLEKVADYIVFIHGGKVLLERPKDELCYRWGILRVGEKDFAALSPGEMVAYRREKYQVDVLVSDKEAARRAHPEWTVDDATIDDILLICVKGVQTA